MPHMAQHKIDCTVPFGAEFRAVILTFSNLEAGHLSLRPANKADSVAARLAELPWLKVVRHEIGKDPDSIDHLMARLVELIPQTLIIISSEESIHNARMVAFQFNNVFHNSPSVVFSLQESSAPIDLVGAKWTFDLGVIGGDEEALCALVKAISEREAENSAIALERMVKVLWRRGDQVLLGPKVIGAL